ncbi:MAG: M23 family metallopeptidase [Alphaproteobacteria bacterium]|nr:M23 family metallopeptidase [Alphaproteobacteria bacterium]
MIRRRDLVAGLTAPLILAAPAAGAAGASSASLKGRITQGGLVFGKVAPGTRAVLDGRTLRVTPDGRFVFGFGRDHGKAASLVLVHADGSRETRPLAVAARKFDVQKITGLPPRMVEPDPADLERIKADGEAIARARTRDSAETGWATDWIWPVTGRISGVFGSQRILNGQPRRPHFGVDVAMPTGTPIVAPADAVVSLANPDMYFTGGTLILDHGHGVGTLYAHLSSLEVRAEQRVRKGEPIGRIGATGRVTGPHLHWGMTWYATNVDPALVVPPMPAP